MAFLYNTLFFYFRLFSFVFKHLFLNPCLSLVVTTLFWEYRPFTPYVSLLSFYDVMRYKKSNLFLVSLFLLT